MSIIVAAGIRASLMNFGVALGVPLIHAATAAGAKSYWTVNTIWFPLLAGGAVPNIAYSIYLLRKNRTSSRFAESGTSFYWFLPAVMAFFWFGSSLLYGAASGMLGNFGAVLGWPLFMSLIVIVASVLGVITGEWKNAGPAPLRIQAGAVAFLVIAVVVLSRASV